MECRLQNYNVGSSKIFGEHTRQGSNMQAKWHVHFARRFEHRRYSSSLNIETQTRPTEPRDSQAHGLLKNIAKQDRPRWRRPFAEHRRKSGVSSANFRAHGALNARKKSQNGHHEIKKTDPQSHHCASFFGKHAYNLTGPRPHAEKTSENNFLTP